MIVTLLASREIAYKCLISIKNKDNCFYLWNTYMCFIVKKKIWMFTNSDSKQIPNCYCLSHNNSHFWILDQYGRFGVSKTWSGYGWLHCRLFGQHWLPQGDAQYRARVFAEPDTLWTSQWTWRMGYDHGWRWKENHDWSNGNPDKYILPTFFFFFLGCSQLRVAS